jgi:hypothetical protein
MDKVRIIRARIKEHLQIQHPVYTIWRRNMFWNGEVSFKESYYLMLIDRTLPEQDQALTIAHELRHIWQYEQGLLRDEQDGIYWGKRKYTYKHIARLEKEEIKGAHNKYDKLPWERDAIKFESYAYTQFIAPVLWKE